MALDLGKMYGPMPLGAWMAVVGGGVGIALWSRGQGGGGEPEIVDDTSGVPGVGEGGNPDWEVTTPTAPPGNVAPTIQTNDQWAVAAINYLIASGYDATVAHSAISKAINSEALSAQEWVMWRMALMKLGSLPDPIPGPTQKAPVPGPVTPTPKPPTPKPPAPKPVPKKFRYYIVRPGDNLTKIGKRYGRTWQQLYNANRYGTRRADGTRGMIRNPNLIFPGWKLLIP